MKRFFFVFCLLSVVVFLPYPVSHSLVFAEDVTITTYYPSPYGSYKQLNVENLDESQSITDFTQSLTKAGLNIITEYSSGAYTPGIFWSSKNDNSTKPKAGIWMYEDLSGSKLLFDTSNAYSVGLHSTPSLAIDKDGRMGVGIATPNEDALLEVNSNTKGFLPPRMTTAERDAMDGGSSAPPSGTVIYNTTTGSLEVRSGTGWTGLTDKKNVSIPAKTSQMLFSTTYVDDEEVLLPMAANEKWQFEFVVRAKVYGDSDFKFKLMGPTIPSNSLNAIASVFKSGATDGGPSTTSSSYWTSIFSDYNDEQTLSYTSDGFIQIFITGFVANGSTAGDLRVQWALRNPPGGNAVVSRARHLRAIKVE